MKLLGAFSGFSSARIAEATRRRQPRRHRRRFAIILRQLLGGGGVLCSAASAHPCMAVAERLSLQDVRNMYLTRGKLRVGGVENTKPPDGEISGVRQRKVKHAVSGTPKDAVLRGVRQPNFAWAKCSPRPTD